MRYIRVFESQRSKTDVLSLAPLEAMFTEEPFELCEGISVAKKNVASVEKGAKTIRGRNKERSILLHGDFREYSIMPGHTEDRIGAGCIMVQLSQRHVLDSVMSQ